MFRTIICALALVVSISPRARADGVVGEAPTEVVYIQDHKIRHLNDNVYEITVTVQAKQAGTYYVVAGFTKDRKWLRGLISGAKYFDQTTVTLGAGDIKTVRITSYAPPLGFKVWASGVFAKQSDIVTNR
jgi:L-amino acid N-acyltransferase YncA